MDVGNMDNGTLAGGFTALTMLLVGAYKGLKTLKRDAREESLDKAADTFRDALLAKLDKVENHNEELRKEINSLISRAIAAETDAKHWRERFEESLKRD